MKRLIFILFVFLSQIVIAQDLNTKSIDVSGRDDNGIYTRSDTIPAGTQAYILVDFEFQGALDIHDTSSNFVINPYLYFGDRIGFMKTDTSALPPTLSAILGDYFTSSIFLGNNSTSGKYGKGSGVIVIGDGTMTEFQPGADLTVQSSDLGTQTIVFTGAHGIPQDGRYYTFRSDSLLNMNASGFPLNRDFDGYLFTARAATATSIQIGQQLTAPADPFISNGTVINPMLNYDNLICLGNNIQPTLDDAIYLGDSTFNDVLIGGYPFDFSTNPSAITDGLVFKYDSAQSKFVLGLAAGAGAVDTSDLKFAPSYLVYSGADSNLTVTGNQNGNINAGDFWWYNGQFSVIARERDSATWRQRLILLDSFGLSIDNFRNDSLSPASLYLRTGRIAGDTITDVVDGSDIAAIVAAPYSGGQFNYIPFIRAKLDSIENNVPLVPVFVEVGDTSGRREVAKFRSDGDVRFFSYGVGRNDTATHYPESFIYPDSSGRLLMAPYSVIRFNDPTTGSDTTLGVILSNIYQIQGGANIYNSDSSLIGNRELDGNGFGLLFDSLTYFVLNTPGAPASTPTSGNIDIKSEGVTNIFAKDQLNLRSTEDDVDILSVLGSTNVLGFDNVTLRSLEGDVAIVSDLGHIDLQANDSVIISTASIVSLDSVAEFVMVFDTLTGRIHKRSVASIIDLVRGDTLNLYNVDDTLLGNRTVVLNSNSLSFRDGTYGLFILDPDTKPGIQLSAWHPNGGGVLTFGNPGRTVMTIADSGDVEIQGVGAITLNGNKLGVTTDTTHTTSDEVRVVAADQHYKAGDTYIRIDSSSMDLNADSILISDSTDIFKIPNTTTAARPASAPAGSLVFNVTDTVFQGYTGYAWVNLGDTTGSGGGGTVAYGRMSIPFVAKPPALIFGPSDQHLTNPTLDLFDDIYVNNVVMQGDSVIISQTADYRISYSYTVTALGPTDPDTRFNVWLNGVGMDDTGLRNTVYTSGRPIKIQGETIISLTSGDVLKPTIARDGGATDYEVASGSFIVEKVN